MSNLEKVDKLVRDDLLQEKDQEQQNPKRIPLILTHNRFLPNLTAVVRKNWNILQTSKNSRELFQQHPVTAFKRKKIKRSNLRYNSIFNPCLSGQELCVSSK